MSTSTLIINLAVLFAVAEADLGTRKVGTMRIIRPLLMVFFIVPLFVKDPARAGSGMALELALTGLGALLGLVASRGLMRVGYDASKGRLVSRAGAAYGLFWAAVIGARVLFVYGSNHWYASSLTHWMATNHISGNALTDGMIFMAIAMTLTRTVRLLVGRTQGRYARREALAVQ